MRKFQIVLLLFVMIILPVSLFAQAEKEDAYPSKPITLIVNKSAGGGSDVDARVLAPYLEKYLGVPCTVVNKTGGDGIVGINEAAVANPDGYTLFVCAQNEVASAIATGQGIEFDENTFTYFGGMNVRSHMLVTKKGSEFKTLEDVVKFAKANPGKLTVGIPGAAVKLGVVDFMKSAGIELTIVNCGSGNEVFAQLLGGHVDLGFPGMQFNDRLVDEGCTVLANAISDTAYGPKVPSFRDLGYDVVYEVRIFLGGNSNLSDSVKAKLTDAMNKAFADPGLKDDIEKLGETVAFVGADDFTEYMSEYLTEFIPKMKAL